MQMAEKACNDRRSRTKNLPGLTRTDSEMTGTTMITDSSKENVRLSSMTAMTKLDSSLPSGCMEARVVLVDLKYGNLLTQQQRRELRPKRRRKSSVTSDRTKHFLKKVVKEEAEWMGDWTSSSTDSFFNPRHRRRAGGKRNASRGRARKRTSKKTNAADRATPSVCTQQTTIPSGENVGSVIPNGKKITKPRGRPRKNVAPCDESHLRMSTESGARPLVANAETSATDCSIGAAMKIKKQRVRKKRERKDQTEALKSYSQGDACCANKNVLNYYTPRVYEEKTDGRKQPAEEPFGAEKSWISPSSVLPRTGETNSLQNNKSEDSTAARCSAKLEMLAKRTSMNSSERTNALNAMHENKFTSDVNGDYRSEDFNTLQPFLQPLEKKHCSLDSIQRAIEHDLATGNHLLPFEDCNIEETINLPTDPVVLPEMLSLDGRTTTLPACRQGQTQRQHQAQESSRGASNGRDASLVPPNFRNSGKRKRPEIIQDALYPRGTIDIPAITSKISPQAGAKRRKVARDRGDNNNIVESTKLWNKLTNMADDAEARARKKQQSRSKPAATKTTSVIAEVGAENRNNMMEITSEEKLSGALRNWSNQPEIAALLDAEPVRPNEDYPSATWCGASKRNRQRGSATRKTESMSTSANSNMFLMSPLASPPISNVSDERKAMSELLFALDHEQPIELTANESSMSTKENPKKTTETASSRTANAKKESAKCALEVAKNGTTAKSVEKLTIENLDKFNTTRIVQKVGGPVSFPTTIPGDFSLSNRDKGSPTVSRKRKWTSPNDDAKAPRRSINGKVKLIRKREKDDENGGKMDERDDRPFPRIDGPRDVAEKTVSINNHFERSSTAPVVEKRQGADRLCRGLPSFGESIARSVGDNDEALKSPGSSSRSSSTSSRSSTSDTSSSDDSRDSNGSDETSRRPVVNDTLENIDEIDDFECGLDLRDVQGRRKVDRVESLEKMEIKPPEVAMKDGNDESRSTIENIELRKPTGNDDACDVDDIELDLGIGSIDHELLDIDDIETPKDLDFVNGNLNVIGTLSNTDDILSDIDGFGEENVDRSSEGKNAGENSDDDKEDCISLFTESLCMSRCASPSLYEPADLGRSPNAHETYARMKSANIGKFVTENNRECEEIFEAYENNGANPEAIFERESILEPLFAESTKPLEAPPKDDKTNAKSEKPDLRSTLNNRSHLRDVTSLFRGQCFAWLRNGNCNANNANCCRFKHSLKPNLLQALRQYKPRIIKALTAYAIENNYSNFLELVRNELMSNMTVLQVKTLYEQLYRARFLTVAYIRSSYDVLKARGLTTVQIMSIFRSIIHEEDGEAILMTLLGLFERIEPDACWEACRHFIAKFMPPVQILRAIVREAVEIKKCEKHANEVWDHLGKHLPFHIASDISADLWRRFHSLRLGKPLDATVPSVQKSFEKEETEVRVGIASPESPRHEPEVPIVVESKKSSMVDIASPEKNPQQPSPSQERGSRTASPPLIFDASYNLQPIDKLPSAKCPYGGNLWKFHWDLKGVQEGLKNKDYAHVISILSLYSMFPNRLPHIEGFYNILCKEITSAKHHIAEIVRLTVQSGTSDALRLYVYDLGIRVLTKLTDVGAWTHAYQLIKTFELYGEHNSCAFTLLAAEVYIANRRPSKALDLLEKSRIVCTNAKKWRQMQCRRDQLLRSNVLDLLLYSLCDGHADHALRLLDFILRDQCSTFQPINLAPHVDRIARLVIFEKRTSLIIDMGRMILQAKLIVNVTTFRSIINHVFHEDRILAKQLHRYATWLGAYNRAKINGSSCAHMIINTDWTEEETFLMITSLIEDLYVNIGHAVERLKPRQLGVFLIFEAVPTDRQLSTDVSAGVLTSAAMNKHRDKVRDVLSRFDPKIKMIQRPQGRICKLQSKSLVDYLKSGQIAL